MARDTKRTKTETLSLRLDPKTKFALDFIAKVRGQSITAVVDYAIRSLGEKTIIGEGEFTNGTNWQAYWDPSEGVRTLRLVNDPSYPTTFEEDELCSFTREHWPFFYEARTKPVPLRHYVEVLWPDIDKYLEIWREKKREDYWAASVAMKEAIGRSGLAAPAGWPHKTKEEQDEEIPF